MELHTLRPPKGANKTRKRVGRGSGSGLGKTSGRGHKGAGQRSGFKQLAWREGGQMPLIRRLPKFGFTSLFKKQWQIINVSDLAKCGGSEITPALLVEAGLIRTTDIPLKVLGDGTVDKAYTVKAAAFSKSAVTKIESAGGKAEVLS